MKGEPNVLITKTEVKYNPVVQCNIRLLLNEKTALIALAKKKGAVGVTGLLKMLAKAERVEITL